jgi:two-component system sensor histidine kinase QseC
LWVVRQAFSHITREAQRLPHDGPPQAGQLASTPQELHPFVDAAHTALRTSWELAQRERRLSRSVAHELRTPVAELRAASERALAQGDTNALLQGMTQVQHATDRMQRGIDALLALARFESGQELAQPDPLDVVLLLQQLSAALESQHLQWQLPTEAWVVCDAGMLERIVANLLHNAVEYGDAGAPVSVRLWRNGDWWLEVRNRASQLHTDDVAHFGERHWRGQRDGDPQHAGVGLALV